VAFTWNASIVGAVCLAHLRMVCSPSIVPLTLAQERLTVIQPRWRGAGA
jgi:hypothetical protein